MQFHSIILLFLVPLALSLPTTPPPYATVDTFVQTPAPRNTSTSLWGQILAALLATGKARATLPDGRRAQFAHVEYVEYELVGSEGGEGATE